MNDLRHEAFQVFNLKDSMHNRVDTTATKNNNFNRPAVWYSTSSSFQYTTVQHNPTCYVGCTERYSILQHGTAQHSTAKR